MGRTVICQMWDKSEAIKVGLPMDERHYVYSWDGCVFVSAIPRGKAIDCHIAAKGRNRAKLRDAIHFIGEYLFSTYSECEAITACVKLKSVKNLCIKCGFESAGYLDDEHEVFVKWARSGTI